MRISPEEQVRALRLGGRRHTGSKADGLHDFLRARNLTSDQVGALGEFGAARFLGYPEPDSVKAYGAADLGIDISVRTRSAWHYELNVRPRDHTEFRFLLVTWVAPYAVMRGWYRGVDAKQLPLVDHGNFKRPAHFVPHELLLAPEALRLL